MPAADLANLVQLAEDTAKRISRSHTAWMDYLKTAARLYKYPYHEQLLIYAQRPEATACAGYEVWNNTMRRYIRRGSKGIALFDPSADTPKLRYVFDLADTGARQSSRTPNQWAISEENVTIARSALEMGYDTPASDGLPKQLRAISSMLANNYWLDHHDEIIGIVDGSFAEEYDELNIGVSFRKAAAISLEYALNSRCGLHPDERFTHEDFLSFFDWNTPQAMAMLGTAISEMSEEVLRTIEIGYRRHERSVQHERTDVSDERRLPAAKPDYRNEQPAAGQVRQDAPQLSEGASPNPVQHPDRDWQAAQPPVGDRERSEPSSGTDDAQPDADGGRDGGDEGEQPDAVGAADERPEGTGRGSDPERANPQLTPIQPAEVQLSFFPTEAEQMAQIDQAESENLSAFSFATTLTQDEIDHVLILGSNTELHRMRVAAEFMKQKPLDDIAESIREIYHGGNGIVVNDRRLCAWYDADGIHLSYGDRARYVPTAQVISWQEASQRVGQLLEEGRFASNVELTEAPAYERQRVAQSLWYLYSDLSQEAREKGYLASLAKMHGGGYPDETARLMEWLTDGSFHSALVEECDAFLAAYHQQRSLLRFHYHQADKLFQRVRELNFERREYASDMISAPEVSRFITEDEIDEAMRHGSGFEFGETRINAFFHGNASLKEKADFLKKEYGIGGRSHALSGAQGSDEWHDGKGIRLKKEGCSDVQLPWPKVAQRISDLIRKGKYQRTAEEKGIPNEAALERAKELINAFCEREFREPADFSDLSAVNILSTEITDEHIPFYVTVDLVNCHLSRYLDDDLFDAREYASLDELIANELEDLNFHTLVYVPEDQQNEIADAYKENDELLTQLKEQCDYFLGAGGRDEKLLWEESIEAHIAKMRELYDVFPIKTEWLTADAIDRYEQQMLYPSEPLNVDVNEPIHAQVQQGQADEDKQDHRYLVIAYHHFENGFDAKLDYRHLEDAEKVAQGYVNGTQESDGFAYDGAAVYDQEEKKYIRIWGDYPDQAAQAQVAGSIQRVSQENSSPRSYSVGETLYLDGRAFEVSQITERSVQMRDVSLAYPIFRSESKANLEKLLLLDERNTQPTYATETVAVYPAEQSHLPYDVVIERLRVDEPEPVLAENFRITDDHLGEGGQKTKYLYNAVAIRTLKRIEEEQRPATPEEQEILSQYVGWGGIPQAFDPDNEKWDEEYAELKELLTSDEYEMARASTLNAHYTSPTVIRAMYDALANMGFATGNILEPACGVGNFFGLLPDEMLGSNLYGVELDSITGRIAKQLYPKANITVAGFETTDRRDFYDIAIGNVPFGNYKVLDKPYDKLNFHIHDYFFAKAIDQVRPGGVIAFITSKGTMDKQSPEVRRYIAQRADLLGAIRLPNNAFKANAGTEVTTDILFLQKRDRPIVHEPDWVHLGQTEDGIPVNSYFAEHPEMVLGKMAWDDSMYGNRKETACLPVEGTDLAQQLQEAISHIRGTYQEAELPDLGDRKATQESIPADPDVKNYSYTIVQNEVYYRENSVMVRPELNSTAKERVRGMVQLRDCCWELIQQQMDDEPDEIIQQTQKRFNGLYDAFTSKYGLINSRGNSQAFSADSAYYLLCSLEILDEDGQLKRKADMFTKRTIRPAQAVEQVDTAAEALALSISEKAGVDMDYMASVSGKSEDELANELRGVIFRVPDPTGNGAIHYASADEYLSGNIRAKLAAARLAAENDDTFQANVAALEQAMPKPLEASEIDVRLGATWIHKGYIQDFMEETFDMPFYRRDAIRVEYSTTTAEWRISGKSLIPATNVAAFSTYGTERASAYKILEDTLNLRDVRIFDTVEDANGKEQRVLNKTATTLAQQKQQVIKEAFRDWVWKDADRRQQLVERYNVLFNSSRPREYDGQHITFSGMNPEITLRPHQRDAIAHILYGGNTLLAHEVGAGKTFEMVAACMESKRLGLSNKALFAVPNHLTEQWASEFLRLYPSANILVTTKKDFEPKNRKKFCARIATGDYDAIIIGHSQFEKIPISQERQEELLNQQIAEIEAGIVELKAQRAERFTIKQMERSKKQVEAKLKKLNDTERKDDVVTFEQLGVDRLYVDEAHNYKNLFLFTKMRNVAGLSTTDAQKSSDMYLKCRYIDEITGGRGVVFATGTPVSNSMTELYTMMRYLQHDLLAEKGLSHFDCWASTFGETVTAIELAPEGTGYRARTRFARFFNLPELMTMFKEVADIKTSDQLHLPVPEAVYHNVAAQPTETQKGLVQELSKRAAEVHGGAVDPSVDNMLKITSDGRKLGLDQRILNPMLPDEEGTKVNLCVENIVRIWQEGEAEKLTQLVFSDISTPKEDGSFTIYEDIRRKLIERGIPEGEIAFIHNADTEAKKKELFGKVRSGQVRVLMGSTAKMGAGTNVQDRLVALHDLDCPWRPGDLEQRKGRIVRQGNQNKQVHIFRYVTEGTFDSYLWQTVETKQRFISQIMTSKSPVRSCEDVDQVALSYAEIKALCAGNPLIKERMDLDIEVSRLRLLKSSHQSNRYKLEDRLLKYFPQEIETTKSRITAFESDVVLRNQHPQVKDGFCGMEICGKMYSEREDAGKALLEACKLVQGMGQVNVGQYRGFLVTLALSPMGKEYVATLHGSLSHNVSLGDDARGNLVRLDNGLAGLENRLGEIKEQLTNLEKQQEAAKMEIEKPFAQEEELRDKSARLLELDALLDIGNKKEVDEPVMDEEALSADEDALSEADQALHKQKGHSLDETEVR